MSFGLETCPASLAIKGESEDLPQQEHLVTANTLLTLDSNSMYKYLVFSLPGFLNSKNLYIYRH